MYIGVSIILGIIGKMIVLMKFSIVRYVGVCLCVVYFIVCLYSGLKIFMM